MHNLALRPLCLFASSSSSSASPSPQSATLSLTHNNVAFASPGCLFRFRKRFHFRHLTCSSFKQSPKKQNPSTNAPQSHRRLLNKNPKGDDEKAGVFYSLSSKKSDEDGKLELEGCAALKGTLLAGLLLVGVVGAFGAAGYLYRDQINTFLTQFSSLIKGPERSDPLQTS